MPSFETEVQWGRVEWFIRLRWIAVVGGAVIVGLGPQFSPKQVPIVPLAACLALLGLMNGVYWAGWKKMGSADLIGPFLHFQMLMDLALLTWMLHLGGGVRNPLILFYLFHLAISSTIFPTVESLFYAFLSLALPFLLWAVSSPGLEWAGDRDLAPFLWAYSVSVAGLWFFLSRLAFDNRSKARSLHQAHEQIRASKEDLERLDDFKNQFLRRVVFQLKNPVVEMDMDLSKAEKAMRVDGFQDLSHLQAAQKRVWALLELIDDLVWLSKLSVGEVPFRKEGIGIYEALMERIQALEPDAEAKGIRFKLHGDPQVQLWADKLAFQRVADSLFSNAVKYTPAGPHSIVVEFGIEGERMIFSVHDEGIGIPPKQKTRIFEEFFRASNARGVEEHGTGLGLAIVKRILDLHGGGVEVRSVPREGTQVVTWWPWKMLDISRDPV